MGEKSLNAGGARHYVSVCSQGYVVHLVAQLSALHALEAAPVACHVLCMDRVTLRILGGLGLPGLRLTPIEDFEDPALLACKPGRTRPEYCWTAKPRFLLRVLEANQDVAGAVYLDADLFPFADLGSLWAELAGADVLLFAHRFPDRLMYLQAIAGRYNAGMVAARNTGSARQALSWWAERCLEWCFGRAEDGKQGDQRYLESFPALFAGVRDCQDQGLNVAPWNVEQYAPVGRNGAVLLAGETPLRLYHFHQYKLLGQQDYQAVSDPLYTITPELRRLVYEPFTKAMGKALAQAQDLVPEFVLGA